MLTIQNKLHMAQRYFVSQEFEKAEEIYQEVIRSHPNDPTALHYLGLLTYQKGDVGGSIDSITKALEADPSYANAYCNLGVILENQGRLDEARVQYKHAIRVYPDYVDAHFGLGRVWQKQGHFNDAVVQYQKVIALHPMHELALKSLGDVFSHQGDLESAVVCFEKAIAVNSANWGTLNNLGVALRKQGKQKEAVEVFRKVVALNPSSGSAYFNWVQIDPLLDEAEIKGIQAQLERSDLDENDRKFLHLSLGLVYHKKKLYDEAFVHTQKGNDLQRSQINYRSEDDLFLLRSIEEIFNREYFETRFGLGGMDSASPVFIFGMPRSGTTLVEQIIATHPLAHGGGEMTLLDDLLAPVVNRDAVFRSLADVDQETVDHLARDYWSHLCALAPEKQIITNKKVDNYLFLGVIVRMFPNAKIIHCKRHPLDNCLSCFLTWFHTGQYFTYDLKELGAYYQAYDKLMKHWQQVLPVPMLDVQYEDLIAKPEEISRQIISYCGLEWDPQCLAFHENTRSVHTASDLQVKQPIYTSSVGRWHCYEKHLTPLKDALGSMDE